MPRKRQIGTLWYVHTMEYYAGIKNIAKDYLLTWESLMMWN